MSDICLNGERRHKGWLGKGLLFGSISMKTLTATITVLLLLMGCQDLGTPPAESAIHLQFYRGFTGDSLIVSLDDVVRAPRAG